MSQHGPAMEDHCVIYFGNDWAAENRTSSHHIATRLKARVPTLYVDSPGLRAPQATGRDFKKIFRKISQAMARPVAIGALGWRCTIPQLPFRRMPGVNTLNQLFAKFAVKRALRLAGLASRPRILWFVVPHPGFLIGHLNERYVVYYCIDDYAAHPGMEKERVAKMDLDLTLAADRVFVAPPSLVQAKFDANQSTKFSPHGVDLELFGSVNSASVKVHESLSDLKKPVIGFFGLVADWIDTSLIEEIALRYPDSTVLLVGHQSTDISRLTKLQNVLFAGPKPYKELPRWAKAFDVAIIPYRLNQQVKNANPLKLREYLATGIPIVAVTNPEIEKFSNVIYIAKDTEDFIAGIKHVLATDSAEKRSLRMKSVSEMSWDNRVSETIDIVNQDLRAIAATTAEKR
jgi:glycosyltransferase involved in cell wall biosynthesis